MKFNSSQSARANILAKLKKQVKGADYSKLPVEASFEYPELSYEQQLQQFVAHLEANQAEVITVSAAQITDVIQQQLDKRNIDQLLFGKQGPWGEQISQLPTSIKLTDYDFELDQHKTELFNDYPAGVTSSYGGIAQTGSIVIWPDEVEPRTLSLVPPLHIVIVDSNEIYQDFTTLVSAKHWHNHLPTNVVLVSGPSKTADIQQTLAFGAHGPKELIVLLVTEDAKL